MLKTAAKHGRQNSDEQQLSVETGKKLVESRIQKMDRLVEHWDRTDVGTGMLDSYGKSKRKVRVAAQMMENQLKYLRKLKESGIQITSAFGTSPENVLRIVRIGVANSNRAEIFTEWPLTSTNDALYFVDRVYGTTLRGATAQDRIYDFGAATAEYGSSFTTLTSTPGTGDGANSSFTGTMSPVPIKPYSVYVIVGNTIVGNDSGSNTLSGDGLSTGTIDYTTGIYSFTTSSAPASGATIQVQAVWDSEKSTLFDSYGDVQLKVTKKNFHLFQHPLYYSYSKFSELVLESTGLGDFEEQVIKGVGDEHAKRRDYTAFQLAKRTAGSNAAFTFNANFAAASEDNDFNHAQRILTKINDISTTIYDEINRGEVTKIVCNGIVRNYFAKHRKWEHDDSQPRVGGSYLAGKLMGVEVYVTQSNASTVVGTSTSGQAICVFKNPQEEGEPSLAFGVLTELSAALDYPELYRKGVLATIEGSISVQPKFLRTLNVTNIT